MNSGILPSAESLRQRTINNPEIREIVKNQLYCIVERIHEVYEEENKITYEPPKDVIIKGLKKKNAQRIIYYQLAKEIVDGGYDLIIDLKPKVIFHISWISDMEATNAKDLDKYLLSHSREQVEKRKKKGEIKEKQKNPQKGYLSDSSEDEESSS